MKAAFRWSLLIAANIVVLGVLGFYRPTGAAPKDDRQPFANATGQREEMIRELRETNALLREQNSLLKQALSDDATHAQERK